MDFKLTRDERLSGRKKIEHLFAKGKSFNAFPFRVIWLVNEIDQPFPASVMFTAPKKKFKKAVARNRLKRLMREAYRKNKWLIYETLNEEHKKIHLSFIFTGNADISYEETEGKIILSLQRLSTEIKTLHS